MNQAAAIGKVHRCALSAEKCSNSDMRLIRLLNGRPSSLSFVNCLSSPRPGARAACDARRARLHSCQHNSLLLPSNLGFPQSRSASFDEVPALVGEDVRIGRLDNPNAGPAIVGNDVQRNLALNRPGNI